MPPGWPPSTDSHGRIQNPYWPDLRPKLMTRDPETVWDQAVECPRCRRLMQARTRNEHSNTLPARCTNDYCEGVLIAACGHLLGGRCMQFILMSGRACPVCETRPLHAACTHAVMPREIWAHSPLGSDGMPPCPPEGGKVHDECILCDSRRFVNGIAAEFARSLDRLTMRAVGSEIFVRVQAGYCASFVLYAFRIGFEAGKGAAWPRGRVQPDLSSLVFVCAAESSTVKTMVTLDEDGLVWQRGLCFDPDFVKFSIAYVHDVRHEQLYFGLQAQWVPDYLPPTPA